MQITEEMVNEFNLILANDNTSIRLKFNSYPGWNACSLALKSDKYIESFIINPIGNFYNTLELFFKSKGIKLTYDGTKSVFWGRE